MSSLSDFVCVFLQDITKHGIIMSFDLFDHQPEPATQNYGRSSLELLPLLYQRLPESEPTVFQHFFALAFSCGPISQLVMAEKGGKGFPPSTGAKSSLKSPTSNEGSYSSLSISYCPFSVKLFFDHPRLRHSL